MSTCRGKRSVSGIVDRLGKIDRSDCRMRVGESYRTSGPPTLLKHGTGIRMFLSGPRSAISMLYTTLEVRYRQGTHIGLAYNVADMLLGTANTATCSYAVSLRLCTWPPIAFSRQLAYLIMTKRPVQLRMNSREALCRRRQLASTR